MEYSSRINIGNKWIDRKAIQAPDDNFFKDRLERRLFIEAKPTKEFDKAISKSELVSEKVRYCLEQVRKRLYDGGVKLYESQDKVMKEAWEGTFVRNDKRIVRDIDQGDSGQTYNKLRKQFRKLDKNMIGQIMFVFRFMRNFMRELDGKLEDKVSEFNDDRKVIDLVMDYSKDGKEPEVCAKTSQTQMLSEMKGEGKTISDVEFKRDWLVRK